MEHGQEAQGWQHVPGAFLQDELVHVEERVFIIIATPAVYVIHVVVTFTGDLQRMHHTHTHKHTVNTCCF